VQLTGQGQCINKGVSQESLKPTQGFFGIAIAYRIPFFSFRNRSICLPYACFFSGNTHNINFFAKGQIRTNMCS